MARTPLIRFFQRLAADHVAEDREAHERVLGRRDALKVAAAAVGVAALARGSAAQAERAPRIAIVGAGIAGLHAALTLQDAGFRTTIYESDDHGGGRIRSDPDTWGNGQVTEWCGEFIDSGHATMIALAQRFGLALDDLLAAEPAGSTETYYFDGHHYPYADACRDFAPVMRVLTRQSNEAPYPTQYDSYTHRALELDQMSVWEWIERYVPGGHHSKLGKLLDAAYDIEFGRATTEQSSLNLVYLLGGSGSSLSVFGESDERFHIRGGNQRLVDAIAAALPTDTVQVSHALTAIERHADGTTRLTFDTPTGTRVITADRVILTLPFSRLRQVDITRAGFDARKRRAIAELGYGTNAKVMLQFARRYWNEPGHAWGLSNGTTYADTGLQSAWDMTRAQPGTAGVFTDYLGSLGATIQPDQGDESFSATSPRVREYAARFMRQLEPVFPGISRHYTGVATLSSQKDDPNLLGTYSCWLVGQYTAFAGYEGVAQGTIHFAGEHCSTDFQGYMEGGAAEGERAATEILAALASAHR